MDQSPFLQPRVRVMQIIQATMILGVVVFAAFLIFFSKAPPNTNQSIVWLMVGFGSLLIVLRMLVPELIVRTMLKQIANGTWQLRQPVMPAPETDEDKLTMLYQQRVIIGAALLEAGAFANLTACMTAGHIANWIMTGVLVLGLIISFPMQLAVERWIEAKLVWIRDERRLVEKA